MATVAKSNPGNIRAYLRIGNGIYIRDYFNPFDGKLSFGSNTLFKYYERKVYGLKKDHWKQETELAIQNQQLYLQFDDEIFYPDPIPMDKGILGYFVSFTINLDTYQGNIVEYIDTSTNGRSFTKNRRYEARIKGLMAPDPIPYGCLQTYFNKLINQNSRLHRFIALDTDASYNRELIPVIIEGTRYHGSELYVYGYQNPDDDSDEPTGSVKKVQQMNLIHQKSGDFNRETKPPYIEDYIDPRDGRLVYSNNTVFRYIERRVWNLWGSWETGTELAISKENLFLNINGRRIFPDLNKINKGIGGYYVSFTINADSEQAKKITYSRFSNSNIGQYKYNAIANRLCEQVPVPKMFIVNYLKKLVALNIHGVGYITKLFEKSIKIKNIELINDNVIVFGDENDVNLNSPLSPGQEKQYQILPPKYEK